MASLLLLRSRRRRSHRALRLERLEQRLPLATDLDDSLSESVSFGTITTTPESVAASISPDTDVDMYRMTVTAGQVIDFDIDTAANGPGGLGSLLRLFNSQGQQLVANNDANAPGENVIGFDAYLRFRFTTAGTYYIGVSNANNAFYNAVTGDLDTAGGEHAIGDYQLTLQALPADPDDTLTEAVLLGAVSTTPSTRSGAITPDIDVDLYRFTVSAGQAVDFDIDTATNGSGGLGSYLRLFNAQGQQLAFNDDAIAPGESVVGFDAYLRFTFTSGGTYYIGVSNNTNVFYNPTNPDTDTAGGFNSIGDYQLIVRALPVDTDDSIDEATQLGAITTTPSTVDGVIDPDIDVDLYGFTVLQGQVVDFDIDTPLNGPGGLGSFLRLFNLQGQLLDFNNDAAAPGESVVRFDAYLRFTFETASTYYIGVSNLNNTQYNPNTGEGDTAGGLHSIGSYQLIVRTAAVEPVDTDDSLTEAVSLGSISTTPVSVDDAIAVDVDVDLYRFTVTGGQVVDFDIDTVINGPGGLGSYLRLFDAQGQQLAFNDNAIAPGESVLGFDAYLRFTFFTAGTYYVGVSNANNTLYSPTTGEGDTSGGPNATGNYRLIVQGLPDDTDDSLSEATPLAALSTGPQTIDEVIFPDIDVDLYSFTVSAGQVVDFDIDTADNGPGGLGSYLRLFNSQGQQLAFNDDAIAPGESVLGFDAYLRFTFDFAGTYYIGVSNANNTIYSANTGNVDTAGGLHSIGNYQLIVQFAPATPVDQDDTLAEAVSLGAISTTPVTIGGSIAPDIDVDIYSFTVAAGQVVDFDIDTTENGPGGLDSFLRVFNAQGQQLSSNNDAAAPGETPAGFDSYLRFTFAAGGTFYVAVSNANNTSYDPLTGNGDTAGGPNSIGDYQLTLQAIATAPADPDDSISEATPLGAISTTPATASAAITPDIDVDLYQFTVTAGQVVDFDIDTGANGPGGLGSYLRLFNAQGQQLAFNDNATAPGEGQVGFDAYLRHTFATAGIYYIGVSNSNNTQYDPITGNGDVAGGANTTGDYTLIVQGVPVGVPTLTLTINPSSISERNGVATGTVTRTNADFSEPLIVTLTSSDTSRATVPPSVTIASNQTSANFAIFGVHDTAQGTTRVTITAAAAGYVTGTQSVLITDSDRMWHNAARPTDVNNDGKLSAIDALLIFNHLNAFGEGPVPEGNPPPFMDVSGDNFISAIDALIVINALNSQSSAQGEGEAAVAQESTGIEEGPAADDAPRSAAPMATSATPVSRGGESEVAPFRARSRRRPSAESVDHFFATIADEGEPDDFSPHRAMA